MTDRECVEFLQWALPRLGMRWPGFRKVRRQVCRRVQARMVALGIAEVAAYRAWLERDARGTGEWAMLGELCRVTISRFRRDHSVWDFIGNVVLPELARRAIDRGAASLRAWSCGCASGDEAATLAIVWELQAKAPGGLPLDVLGTDIDDAVLQRARRACWPDGSLRELPDRWRDAAFEPTGSAPDRWRLHDRFRVRLRLDRQDVREQSPAGVFDLVLCRNLVFTYFDDASQCRVLDRLIAATHPSGAIVLGRSERPPATRSLAPWNERESVWHPRNMRRAET